MKNKNIILILLGIVVITLSIILELDTFWNSAGFAFLVVGATRYIRVGRLERNPELKDKYEVMAKDERIQYIRLASFASAAYYFVIIAAILSYVFMLMEKKTLGYAASFSVLLIIALYWVNYYFLGKKY